MRSGLIILTLSLLGVFAVAAPAPEPVAQSHFDQSGFSTAVKNIHVSILNVINDIVQQRPAFSDFTVTGRSLDGVRNAYFPPQCPQNVGLPTPATNAAQALQYLQQVQLDLDIVTQNMINGDTVSALSVICVAINLYNGGLASFLQSSSTSAVLLSSTVSRTSATSPISSGGVTSFITPTTYSTPVSSTSASVSPASTDCQSQENACRTAPQANQAYCSSQAASCQNTCSISFNTCSTAPNANHAFCASQYAGCLGYNPFTTTSTLVTASTTAFVCNLAHSYPSPASCVYTNGSIAFVTTPPTYATATGA